MKFQDQQDKVTIIERLFIIFWKIKFSNSVLLVLPRVLKYKYIISRGVCIFMFPFWNLYLGGIYVGEFVVPKGEPEGKEL